jgi:hypothetical protein
MPEFFIWLRMCFPSLVIALSTSYFPGPGLLLRFSSLGRALIVNATCDSELLAHLYCPGPTVLSFREKKLFIEIYLLFNTLFGNTSLPTPMLTPYFVDRLWLT